MSAVYRTEWIRRGKRSEAKTFDWRPGSRVWFVWSPVRLRDAALRVTRGEASLGGPGVTGWLGVVL